jgi:anti-anti-sigma factor
MPCGPITNVRTVGSWRLARVLMSHKLLSALGLGAAVVVIDMSATTFCDSAGVQAIITAYRHAAANGTQLRLVATTMLRILALVGADQLVPIYPTLDAALADAPPAQASMPDPGYEPGHHNHRRPQA